LLPPPPPSSLFPYTTLFRSCARQVFYLRQLCYKRQKERNRARFSQPGFDFRHLTHFLQGWLKTLRCIENVKDFLILIIHFFEGGDRKSTRLNSSHVKISYAV